MFRDKKVFVFTSLALAIFAGSSAFAVNVDGGTSGGGGDSLVETRFDFVRTDLLKWIGSGSAESLKFPSRIDYPFYKKYMEEVLQPHEVIVSSVTTEQEEREKKSAHPDSERIVEIDGQSKTCRGFVSRKDSRKHILCNAERFAATAQAEQYRLIHHEFAGLAGNVAETVERNVGASSDYEISNQITDYLIPEVVLRLAVRSKGAAKSMPHEDFCEYIDKGTFTKDGAGARCSQNLATTPYEIEAPLKIRQTLREMRGFPDSEHLKRLKQNLDETMASRGFKPAKNGEFKFYSSRGTVGPDDHVCYVWDSRYFCLSNEALAVNGNIVGQSADDILIQNGFTPVAEIKEPGGVFDPKDGRVVYRFYRK